ncbi:MAG: MCP four helix bundle domain-containing protein [Bacteroidales bacterium]|nr:MCP four helix bundle domain-containing protein [Bacteroidales bacterium]MBN2697653.1 MCP four helix bundle domain-containing protein [Bacteroidales bacterium]
MKRKLKYKILGGFGLLIAMLILAGTVSIIEFMKLSKDVNALIEDNYKTILAAKSMLEALEREDSGILLLLLGQWDDGRIILDSADNKFMTALDNAGKNITEPREDIYIEKIRESYQIYHSKWQRPIVDTDKQGDINWYEQDMHKSFLEVKSAVNDLMILNQTSMYKEASLLKEKSRRAIMPGIVSIVAALVFSIILNYFITKNFISPLNQMVDAVREVGPGNKVMKTDISSEDELKLLENEINKLINRLS